MKKLNESEMKMFNGGWVYGFTDPKDEYLPIGNFQPGDIHEREGSYTVAFGGKVAYISGQEHKNPLSLP